MFSSFVKSCPFRLCYLVSKLYNTNLNHKLLQHDTQNDHKCRQIMLKVSMFYLPYWHY